MSEPASKKPCVSRPTAATWKGLISASEFGRVSVHVGDEVFGLRPNQEAELVRWVGGKWDRSWLAVRRGMPASFVSQAGVEMNLMLDQKDGQGSSTAPAAEAEAAEAAAKEAEAAAAAAVSTVEEAAAAAATEQARLGSVRVEAVGSPEVRYTQYRG